MPMSMLLQLQSHKNRLLHRCLIILVDNLKPKPPIELLRRRHLRQCIQAHSLISQFSRFVDNRLNQFLPRACSSTLLVYLEPLHFTPSRCIPAEGDAADDRIAGDILVVFRFRISRFRLEFSDQQGAPFCRCIFPRKGGQFVFEVLEAEVDSEGFGIGGKERQDMAVVLGELSVSDGDGHFVFQYSL